MIPEMDFMTLQGAYPTRKSPGLGHGLKPAVWQDGSLDPEAVCRSPSAEAGSPCTAPVVSVRMIGLPRTHRNGPRSSSTNRTVTASLISTGHD